MCLDYRFFRFQITEISVENEWLQRDLRPEGDKHKIKAFLDQNHRVVKARIAHLGRSNQQLTCERRVLRGFFGRRQGRIQEPRRKKNRCDGHTQLP